MFRATPQNKRVKSIDDEAFAKTALEAFPWLFKPIPSPQNITYEGLLLKSERMWRDDKIWVNEYALAMFESFVEQMVPEERAKHEALHSLGKEFVFLGLKKRFMRAIEWKMETMTYDDFIEMEKATKVLH